MSAQGTPSLISQVAHHGAAPGRAARLRMDRATHEEEAGSLAASGAEAVMERYWEACAVVVELWRSGVYVGRIARRAGLGHGYIYGMLRAAGENPK